LRQPREGNAGSRCASATPDVARAQFALPGLLFRNIATTDLYSADWKIVGASITFKARDRRLCLCSRQALALGPTALTRPAGRHGRRVLRVCLHHARALRCAAWRGAGAGSTCSHCAALPLHRRPGGGALACDAQRAHLPQLRRHRRAGARPASARACAAPALPPSPARVCVSPHAARSRSPQVLSAMFPPAMVKIYMGLLLMARQRRASRLFTCASLSSDRLIVRPCDRAIVSHSAGASEPAFDVCGGHG
jgi:hypothetical protein